MNQKKSQNKRALRVSAGVEKPENINPKLKQKSGLFKKAKPTLQAYFDGIRSGNRTMLSRAITLIESTLPQDQKQATELINKCLPYSGNALRIGITGIPGAGKSTFIESFGLMLIEKNHRVAVLAIDPSSQRSHGSILGDKTRMERLSTSQNTFIRPSASAGTLGGVARKTRESMILCEAAGYDIIFVETIGVGQSEITVANMVDFFLLLMIAGSGDELQGIKRGIIEMADLIVINKADGENKNRAETTRQEFENALQLFAPLSNGWRPSVLTASALYGQNLKKIWQQIQSFVQLTGENGAFEAKRKKQDEQLFEEALQQGILDRFFQQPLFEKQLQKFKALISKRKISPYEASQKLLDLYFDKK